MKRLPAPRSLPLLLALLALAGCARPPGAVTGVTAGSNLPALASRQSALLSAEVTGSGDFDRTVLWSVVSGGGSLSAGGGAEVVYTAPEVSSDGAAVVRAASRADPSRSATVSIALKAPSGRAEATLGPAGGAVVLEGAGALAQLEPGALRREARVGVARFAVPPAAYPEGVTPAGPQTVLELPLDALDLEAGAPLLVGAPAAGPAEPGAAYLAEVRVELPGGRAFTLPLPYAPGEGDAVAVGPATLKAVFEAAGSPPSLRLAVQPLRLAPAAPLTAPRPSPVPRPGGARPAAVLPVALTGLYRFTPEYDHAEDAGRVCGPQRQEVPYALQSHLRPATAEDVRATLAAGKIPLVLVHGWTGLEDLKGLAEPARRKTQRFSALCYWEDFVGRFHGDGPGRELRRRYDLYSFAYDGTTARLVRNAHFMGDAFAAVGMDRARPVVLAHSMGGLVAHHYRTRLAPPGAPRHVLTLGTPYRGVSAFLCTRADADQCLEAALNPAVADGLLPALAGLDAKAALASLALEAGETLVSASPSALVGNLAPRVTEAGARALTLFLYGFAAGVFTTHAPATLDLAYELGGLPTYTFKVCPLAVCTVGLSASKPNPALARLNGPGQEGGLEGYTALVGETGRGDGDRMYAALSVAIEKGTGGGQRSDGIVPVASACLSRDLGGASADNACAGSAMGARVVRLGLNHSELAAGADAFGAVAGKLLEIADQAQSVSISLTPSGPLTLAVGGEQVFAATVSGSSDTAVDWSLSPGGSTLTADGNRATFKAGQAGAYTVTATSRADPARRASASVTVSSTPTPPKPAQARITAGRSHVLAIKPDGTVWGWGSNSSGQLGDGTLQYATAPVQAAGVTDATAVAAGDGHSLALRSDGTVWAWGDNAYGQLGTGRPGDEPTPVRLEALEDVAAVAAGGLHSLALRRDGTVWAWGYNGQGQLGTGDTENRSTPARIGTLAGVGAVAAGASHSLVLDSQGRVWAWGYNGKGQLGRPAQQEKSTVPLEVPGLPPVEAISAGGAHSLALAGGAVWGWGDNGHGQVGDGTKGGIKAPLQVPGLSGVSAVAAGEYHSLALLSDGSARAWGPNFSGELGTGLRDPSYSPAPVDGGPKALAIAAGVGYSLAVAEDTTVWSWGGLLGDGTRESSLVPVPSRLTPVLWTWGGQLDTYRRRPVMDTEGNLYLGAANPPRVISLAPGGAERWSYPLDQSASSVLFKLRGDGSIMVGMRMSTSPYDLVMLLSPSGQHIWTKPMYLAFSLGLSPSDWMISQSAVPYGPKYLHVYQPDGSPHGQYEMPFLTSHMVFGPEGQLYLVHGSSARHFNYTAGKADWVFSFADDNAGRPAIGRDGTIYVALRRKLFAVNPDGSERWQVALPFEFACREIVIDRNDNLYCPALNGGIIHSFTPDGALRWQVASRNRPVRDIAVGSDGMVYVLGSVGIDTVSPDGKVRPVTSFPGDFLILGNGAFYTFGDGIIAFPGAPGLDESAPWPALEHDYRNSGQAR